MSKSKASNSSLACAAKRLASIAVLLAFAHSAMPTDLASANEPADLPDVAALKSVLHDSHETGWYMRAHEVLMSLYYRQNDAARLQAAHAMADMLSDADATVRWHAAWSFSRSGRWRPKSEVLVAALLKAIEDPDHRVREAVVSAIADFRDWPDVEQALIDALADSHWEVRWSAITAFGDGTIPDPALDPIANVINDPDRRVGIAAAFAIQSHRPTAETVLPTLIRRFRRGVPDSRAYAAEQLQFFWSKTDGGPVTVFAEMLLSEQPRIMQIGATQLRYILGLFDHGHLSDSAGAQVEAALPTIQQILAAQSDGSIRETVANLAGGSSMNVPQGITLDDEPCISFDKHGVLGLDIPGDRRALQDLLGEPEVVTSSIIRISSAGLTFRYMYRYSGFTVAVSRRRRPIIISASSSAHSFGPGVRVGATLGDSLTLLGLADQESAEFGWLGRHHSLHISNCDAEYSDTHMTLHYDDSLTITKIEAGFFFAR